MLQDVVRSCVAVLVRSTIGYWVFPVLIVLPACEATRVDTTPLYSTTSVLGGKVGVFDRTRVLTAYYRSTYFEQLMAELRAQHDAAKAVSDSARMAELEARGSDLQEIAHQQLAGKAPLDNVSAALAFELPAIASAAGVARIVPKDLVAPSTDTTDVTDAIVAALPPLSPGSR